MREIFSLGKLKGINLTRFSPQFSPHFSPHMSGARFTASTICTFFLEILKKISPVRSAELPKVADSQASTLPRREVREEWLFPHRRPSSTARGEAPLRP